MNNQNKTERSFTDTMHIYGRVCTAFALLMMLSVPVLMCFYLDVTPYWPGLLQACLGICIVYMPVSIVEVIAYAPILGTGASYLAYITGNLSNMKIPCAVNAREMAEVEYGTTESEVVSTLSVAVSALVTTLVLTLGVLLMALTPAADILTNPTLQPAFSVVLPALFGALGFTYFTKNPKVAILPFVIVVAVCLIAPSMGGQVVVLLPVAGLISILWGRFLYKKGQIQ